MIGILGGCLQRLTGRGGSHAARPRARRVARRRLAEIGKLFGFDGETGAERIWGRRWKYHLARTLHCKFELYFNVTMYAKDSLEYFDGLPFALADAWKHFDALAESDESKVLPVG